MMTNKITVEGVNGHIETFVKLKSVEEIREQVRDAADWYQIGDGFEYPDSSILAYRNYYEFISVWIYDWMKEG